MPIIQRIPVDFSTSISDPLCSDLLKNNVFRLLEFVIHPRRNVIESSMASFRIEPKIMDVLIALATSRGDVLLRDELISIVWGDNPGGDERLTRAVSKLRKVFRDNPQAPRFLETVPKRGYRLACVVETENDAATLPGER